VARAAALAAVAAQQSLLSDAIAVGLEVGAATAAAVEVAAAAVEAAAAVAGAAAGVVEQYSLAS
jgi:hypothetical protein